MGSGPTPLFQAALNPKNSLHQSHFKVMLHVLLQLSLTLSAAFSPRYCDISHDVFTTYFSPFLLVPFLSHPPLPHRKDPKILYSFKRNSNP